MVVRKMSRAMAAALALGLAATWTARWMAPGRSDGSGLNRPVADVVLRDGAGQTVTLESLHQGHRAIVLVFLGVDCPVANLYVPRLSRLARDYGPRGVRVVGVNANAHESAAQVAAHARAFGANFPILKDPENRAADRLGVERTCEALLLDQTGRLRYRGAIDDQYGLGARRDEPSRHHLAEALDAVLQGRDVERPTTAVVGCPIERASPRPALDRPRIRPMPAAIRNAWRGQDEPATVGRVTYNADVAPILMAKCQACHRTGQVAPFALLTYEQARRRRTVLREVIEDRRMPPWHADPRYGQFENDRSLNPRERAVLLAWIDQDCPEGDPADRPTPRTFPEGWSIGTPDLVLEMPEPFTVPAEGTVPIQHFRVPTHFASDLWVQAAEVRPGDRAVVHHIFVLLELPDRDPAQPKPPLAGYAPGDIPSIYPEGTAKKVPAGATLKFEIHYTPIGRPRSDRSSIGLILARAPVRHRAFTRGIPNRKLVIPPGAANHEVRSSWTAPHTVKLLSLMPHMHLRGKDFTYTAVFPDGRREILLAIPAYDFGWQSVYRLARPKRLPRGTRIDCVAHFDNSTANPNNPDPSREVRWGDQTWDEMMIGYFDYADCLSEAP
jgi:peroxiredoxin